MPQCLYSVRNNCQCDVGSREIRLKIKFASYSVYTSSAERPYSVHTTFLHRLCSVLDASTARKQLLQRVHALSMIKINAAAWYSRRMHSAHIALLATVQRAPRRSVLLERCENAVRTPLWCESGLTHT